MVLETCQRFETQDHRVILVALEIQFEVIPTAIKATTHQDIIKIARLETLLETLVAVPQEITTVDPQEAIHLITVATIRAEELRAVIMAVEDHMEEEDKI